MELHKFYDWASQWLIINGSKLLIALIILLVGLRLIKLFTVRIRTRMSKREVHSSLQPFFLSLTITALYVLLIILVLNTLGYPLTVFSTILGGFTVAVGWHYQVRFKTLQVGCLYFY